MKKSGRIFSSIVMFAITLVMSCNNDEDQFTSQDTRDITEESLSDAYFQDLDDLTAVTIAAPSDVDYDGGRVASSVNIQDNRFQCDGVLITLLRDPASTQEMPKGVITVDFGAGCEDLRGNVRTGKIIMTYSGRRFIPGSTVVTTLENYTINSIKLEGTRILTNVQENTSGVPRFNAVLENGKATFPDGSIAERTSSITWQWVRAVNPADDKLIIDNNSVANGKTRGGRTYEVSLIEDLVYKRFCGMAVQGIKKYVINGSKNITIDYGDGTCDRLITVTVNDITRNVSVN
jgi:hypothetical protein